ncbi:MAG: type II secretion system F family protein [Nanoarchaeota archaeon]
MEFKTLTITGIGLGVITIIVSLFFFGQQIFYFLIGIGVVITSLPFIIDLINESRIQAEKEDMFLEFTRNLVESVKAGTPISKSIVNIRSKPYGVLSSHVHKLANQIIMGIPLSNALQTFSKDINNKSVSRALTLIGQAEKAGGDIGEILESVAGAVSMSDKLKKERKSAISTLVVQGYIIFFVFMIIILVMQFKILPMVAGIGNLGSEGIEGIGIGGEGVNPIEFSNAFLYLLLVQGLFSGLTIGQLAEGNIKSGVKHSFALMLSAFLISSGANLFL